MAEAVGLAIGVAGLATLFGATVDAFDQIKAAKSFSRDYEILTTRYDIRRARLLQWGDGVGLLSENQRERDPRLDQEDLNPLLERALACIGMLLSDANCLQAKYGLKQIPADEDNAASTALVNVSQQRLQIFKISYSRFLSRVKDRQKQTPITKKTQWAISGGEDFRALLQDLDGMIEDLYKLVPIRPAFQRLMIKEDIAGLPEDLASLKLVEEACAADGAARQADADSWLDAASQRVEATEMATQDRRNVDEWLADVDKSNSSMSDFSDVQVAVASTFDEGSREKSPRPPIAPVPRPVSTSQTSPVGVKSVPLTSAVTHAFNPYTIYPLGATLNLNGDLDAIAKDWALDELKARRRLVQFNRSQVHGIINAEFKVVAPEDRLPISIIISCIWWKERNEYFVTILDTIFLLEALIGVYFTDEETNRIRRNLEGFRPLIISKSKADSEDFFKVIMGFPKPKPQNIEKEVKVFPWKILSLALKKIISKYQGPRAMPYEEFGGSRSSRSGPARGENTEPGNEGLFGTPPTDDAGLGVRTWPNLYLQTRQVTSILFVCKGNLCRSPMAEAVLSSFSTKWGLPSLRVASAGLQVERIGQPIDSRAMITMQRNGVAFDNHSARKFQWADFVQFEYILAMDNFILTSLRELKRKYIEWVGRSTAKVHLFGKYSGKRPQEEIMDPYSGSMDDFDIVYEQVMRFSDSFLEYLRVRSPHPQPEQTRQVDQMPEFVSTEPPPEEPSDATNSTDGDERFDEDVANLDSLMALDVDDSYQPPAERPIKPVCCIYVRPIYSEDESYRAVYLMRRTVTDIVSGICGKLDVDPRQVIRLLCTSRAGYSILMDEDMAREMLEGQHMKVEFSLNQSRLTRSEKVLERVTVDGNTTDQLLDMWLIYD